MNVRELSGIGLAMVLAVVVRQGAQAEGGRPSQQTLREMGLGGLTIMSDDDAIAIRGHGYNGGHGGSSVSVAGNSFATFDTPFGTSHSENQYGIEGKKFAFGKNYSEAGVKLTISKGKKRRGHGHDMRPHNGGHGRMNGGHYGNHHGRPGGGHRTVISFKLFAGGFSFARAH
jgi:hypothetical protein